MRNPLKSQLLMIAKPIDNIKYDIFTGNIKPSKYCHINTHGGKKGR